MESYIRNCVIEERAGDGPLFSVSENQGKMIAEGIRLDGYAIVPVEIFNEMVRATELSRRKA